MLEATFRRIHRTFGMYLVGFLALQAVTGLFLALGTLSETMNTWWFALMGTIHHGWHTIGSAYRVLLAVLTLGQAAGGVIIYLLMRARQKKS